MLWASSSNAPKTKESSTQRLPQTREFQTPAHSSPRPQGSGTPALLPHTQESRPPASPPPRTQESRPLALLSHSHTSTILCLYHPKSRNPGAQSLAPSGTHKSRPQPSFSGMKAFVPTLPDPEVCSPLHNCPSHARVHTHAHAHTQTRHSWPLPSGAQASCAHSTPIL